MLRVCVAIPLKWELRFTVGLFRRQSFVRFSSQASDTPNTGEPVLPLFETLSERLKLYAHAEAATGHAPESSLDWISLIPENKRRLPDYAFTARTLLVHGTKEELEGFLNQLAQKEPGWWEQVVPEIFPKLSLPDLLRTFVSGVLRMGISLTMIGRENAKHRPIVRILNSALTSTSVAELQSALIELRNSYIGSQLASAILHSMPLSAANIDRTQAVWDYKVSTALATPRDLRLVMAHYSAAQRAGDALEEWDKHPELHDLVQSDAVLIAAAQVRDWDRLQRTFEALDTPEAVKTLGSRHYELVLQALGQLGGRGLLEEVWQSVPKATGRLSRGLYHALMHSYGKLGFVDDSRRAYDEMTGTHGIEPVRATFSIVLSAYRDARDLKGALSFIGTEMIAKHGLGLSNRELSVLLSLCALRRDAEAGRRIWEWAESLGVKADARSWNALLSCWAEANEIKSLQRDFDYVMESFGPRLDSLTVVLSAAARLKIVDLAEHVQRIRLESKIPPDATWYNHLLRYHATLGNSDKVNEIVSKEMPENDIKPLATHLRLSIEVAAKAKQWEEARKVRDELIEDRVPMTFSAVEEVLRLETRPGSTPQARQHAATIAERVILEGVFDESSSSVPRTEVPSRVLRPVIRRLIKSGDLERAERLLDVFSARCLPKQHDVWLWALRIEVAGARSRWRLVSALWPRFLAALRSLFVLQPAATFSSEGTKTAVQLDKSKPKYRLAHRHRRSWNRQCILAMQALAHSKQPRGVQQFPKDVKVLGIEWGDELWNAWIQAHLDAGLVQEAFGLVAAATRDRNPRIRRATMSALQKHWPALLKLLAADGSEHDAEKMAVSQFGSVAEFIRHRAREDAASVPRPDRI